MTQSLEERINSIQESKDSQDSEKNQLITIDSNDALELFTDETKLKELIFIATLKTRTLIPDVFTEKGRKDIASMAYSVARTKTYLDSIGKDLVSHYKEIPKKIDSVRKFARDSLDLLRDEVRKPLDKWENEQAQLKLIEEIKDAHIVALEMNRSFDEIKAEQLALEEKRKKEYEQMVKEKAQKEAQERLEHEKIALERAYQHQLAQAEQNRIKAIAQAEIDKENEIIAERKRAEQQQRIIEDKKRLDEENKIKEKQKKEEERNKLMNDIKHREFIQMTITNDLKLVSCITYEDARLIIQAIDNNLIPYLSINY
jgi:hypothetical protein